MKKIIEVKGLTFSYPPRGEENKVLNNISLSVQEGEWLAIIGSNGSGKSTLVKTLNGILAGQEGQIWVDGDLLSEETVWTIRQKIGMVFQNPENQFVGSTVGDDVAFGMENQGVPRPEMQARVLDALDKVGMVDFIDREPSSLSGGQKQRVAIAGVLALQPKVIVLDESTSMLDPKARQEIITTIRRIKEDQGLTVISITHDINEAAEANRIAVMKAGQIIDIGTSRDIFSKGQDLINLGLDVPFAEKLKVALRGQGVEVPDQYMTTEELEEWLWTSSSTT